MLENKREFIPYLKSLHLVYSLKFELSLTFGTITELITVPFSKTNHTICTICVFNIVKKNATLLIFLLQGVDVETANQCRGRKKTSAEK